MNYYMFFILCLILQISIFPNWAYTQKELTQEDFFKMSLEELMDVKITTATKFKEKATHAPATVIVITKEDLKKQRIQ